MKKVLFTATVDGHILSFHTPYLKYFKENGWEVHVASLGENQIPFCDQKFDINFRRSPFSLSNIVAYYQLKEKISNNKYEIIHCHTPVGGFLTRLASRKTRKMGTKVIYTAHGFHFFKGAPLMNWIVFYPIERWLAQYTDLLITINNEDYQRAKKFKVKKLVYMPGVGVDIQKITNITIDKQLKKKELGLKKEAKVLLSVGEINRNKNHKMVIESMAKINDPNLFYIICGTGGQETYLKNLCENLSLADRVLFVGFRHDVYDYFKLADIFVFPSFREGLPVSLMEAMAAGLPVVASRIRGNVDLIDDGVGGFLNEPNDIEGFVNSIQHLLRNNDMMHTMGMANQNKIINYDINVIEERMGKLYNEI